MRNFVFNRSIKLRRETTIKLAKLFENGRLKWELPKLTKLPALKDLHFSERIDHATNHPPQIQLVDNWPFGISHNGL